MNENRNIALVAGGLLLALGLGFYFLIWPQMRTSDESEPAALVSEQAAASSVAESPQGEPAPPQHEMPAVEGDPATLPALGESDSPFIAAIDGLIDPVQRAATLVSAQLIQHIVVTIDNLPREKLRVGDRAFKRVPGEFMVHSRDGLYTLNPSNESRYLPYATLLRTAGAEATAKVYLRFYPLFDKAYRELGYTDRRFNDRLVQVIDHLLATPEVEGPIELVQPKVFYQFADPELEARSAGQKMLIRMGIGNQQQVKIWLKAFRARIVADAPAES